MYKPSTCLSFLLALNLCCSVIATTDKTSSENTSPGAKNDTAIISSEADATVNDDLQNQNKSSKHKQQKKKHEGSEKQKSKNHKEKSAKSKKHEKEEQHKHEKDQDKKHKSNSTKNVSEQQVGNTEGNSGIDVEHCAVWIDPLVTPRAAVLCIHGLGLNSNAYRTFGTRMGRRGIATYAIDVRGFGTWIKDPHRANLDFPGTIEDIKNALIAIHKVHPKLPVFILGESMGGAIAIRAAATYPELITGMIAAVPASDRFDGKKQKLNVALHTLEGPKHQFNIGKTIVNQATQNQELSEIWESDPLNRLKLSPVQLMHFQKFMTENIKIAHKIKTIPTLILQGTQDALVKPQGSWDIFKSLGNEDKAFIAFPSEHLILEYDRTKSDANSAKIAQVAANWIYEHVPFESNIDLPPSFTSMKSTLFSESLTLDEGDPNNNKVIIPEPFSLEMRSAIMLFIKEKYNDAIKAFTELIKKEPDNFKAHVFLSMSYEKTGQAGLAYEQACKARLMAKNREQKVRINQALMLLLNNPDAFPKSQISSAAEISKGKATVLYFRAPWCEDCRLDEIALPQTEAAFASKVQFKRLNIEDAQNEEIRKLFQVTVVPSYIFLKADGTVTETQFGRTRPANLNNAIFNILR